VLDAHAEPEGPHRRDVGVLVDLVNDEPRPGIRAGVGGAERVDVVAAATPPRDVAQVDAVMDAEVQKRRQVLLVDCVPQPQLGRDAIVEPVQDRQPVAALRGGGQSEQLDRRQGLEDALVGGRGGVVELIDDDDVEVVRRQCVEVGGAEALDRGEDVVEPGRARAADPFLAERGVAHRIAERRQALVEDLFAVGDEQQTRPWQPSSKRSVVQRCHHGLAGTGGGDEQVAVMTALA
jgi:hypothetical protein